MPTVYGVKASPFVRKVRVCLAEKTIAGVGPPTRLLAEAGALIALIVVGASGVFLVARRRAEARTLFARGEAVSSFAARTMLEALLPSIAGAVVGVAVALALIRVVEPNGTIEPSTLLQGAAVAGAAPVRARVHHLRQRAHCSLRALDYSAAFPRGSVHLRQAK